MVIHFRCSLLGCDLNFENVKNKDKSEASCSSECVAPTADDLILLVKGGSSVLHFLLMAELFKFLLHKIKFTSCYGV